MDDLGMQLFIGILWAAVLPAAFYFGLRSVTRWAAALYESSLLRRQLDKCPDIAGAARNAR